jgi:predicted lipid-binding transport protein (Tim44 family)
VVVALVVLGKIGWHVGRALGGARGRPGPAAAAPGRAPAGPEPPDLILDPAEVAVKAGRTTLLMQFLARHDRRLDPATLRPLLTATFCKVQECWEARDYGPVSALLRPDILAEHEGLLWQMRQAHEINRIQGLRVEAVHFVHLFCPLDPDDQEVAALITFEATANYVNDRNGTYTRGPRSPRRFQEFWVFRRQGERWLLDAIERTHESKLLRAANQVAGLSAEQLENA